MANNNDVLHWIALTLVDGIGSVHAKTLLEHFETPEHIFKAKQKSLTAINGISIAKANAIRHFADFEVAESIIEFCNKHHIQILTPTNTAYPQRLLHCYDYPTVLFYRGNANLNAAKVVSIIGTRNSTDYGKQITEQIVEALAPYQTVIVSGLAFGIDALAHKAAIKNNLPTVGVLAHGLHTIYPVQHKALAKDMLLQGGLLTEFNQFTKADKHNFPRRNRIVAGMSDCTIVVETAIKGGSMITAELAFNYNKEVFAVPGKLNDTKSAGCNKLIYQNKATLFTSVTDMAENLGWQSKGKQKKKIALELFTNFTPDEQTIVNILQQQNQTHIDALYLQSGLHSSAVATAILNLELQNIIESLPGKQYRLLQ
jgi:DNA processing protein